MAGMMSKPFTRNLEAALARLGKVNMALILKTWPRKMWERLIEQDEFTTWQPEEEKEPQQPMDPFEQMNGQQPPQGPSPEEQEKIANKWMEALDLIRPQDPTKEPGISLLDVDVRVAAGSTTPTNHGWPVPRWRWTWSRWGSTTRRLRWTTSTTRARSRS
jgi:hypothetical protein